MANDQDARLDRRQILKTFTLGAVLFGAPGLASGPGKLKGTEINHVSYSSADYIKTRDFYSTLFGFQVAEQDERQLYLWAGDALISAKNTPAVKGPLIDHFGLTVDPWDVAAVEAALHDRGLVALINRNDPHDTQHRSAFTRDVNGYNLQLGAPNLEIKPAPAPSTAPLKATGINHLSYQSADYGKTRDFYTELLGVPVSKDDGKQAYLWFGDAFMVVRNTPDGGRAPIIDHVAWTLADWDPRRVATVLQQHGLESSVDAAGKSIMTRDLNGYPLQLCSSDLEKRP